MIGRPWTAEAGTIQRTSSGSPETGWGRRRSWCRWGHARGRVPPEPRSVMSRTRRGSTQTGATPADLVPRRLRFLPQISGEAAPQRCTMRSSRRTVPRGQGRNGSQRPGPLEITLALGRTDRRAGRGASRSGRFTPQHGDAVPRGSTGGPCRRRLSWCACSPSPGSGSPRAADIRHLLPIASRRRPARMP